MPLQLVPYATWVEVDLDAIRMNVKNVLALKNSRVMAVVKADGYGHGAIAVAKAALQAGASWLGVARFEEAMELRTAGIQAPILLLGYLPPQKIALTIQYNISMTVWREDQVQTIATVADHLQSTAKLHLKIDSGMSRIGAQPEEVLPVCESIASHPNLLLEGVFTHFARADEEDPQPTFLQLEVFQQSLTIIEKFRTEKTLIHTSNSAAAISPHFPAFDMVRLGIAMYGLHPSPATPLSENFKPALSWKTVLSHVKTLPVGRGVSYGHIYTTTRKERIGTLPVGYADGFRRWKNNQALIHGIKVPVVGRVCMDQCMVQLDPVPDARAGDEVVLIGYQESEHLSAEEVASAWGTINYEVVCGIGKRVPRIYLNQITGED
ncbi:MAG: alanine racemase [Anaerolineales bacterium]